MVGKEKCTYFLTLEGCKQFAAKSNAALAEERREAVLQLLQEALDAYKGTLVEIESSDSEEEEEEADEPVDAPPGPALPPPQASQVAPPLSAEEIARRADLDARQREIDLWPFERKMREEKREEALRLTEAYLAAQNDSIAAVFEPGLVAYYEARYKTTAAALAFVRSMRRPREPRKKRARVVVVSALSPPQDAVAAFDDVADENTYHLTDPEKISHYVGRAPPGGVQARIEKHWSGESGVAFARNLTVRAPLLTQAPHGEFREWVETLTQMREFGIANVRGARYATETINARDAFVSVADVFGLCYRCGRKGHSSASCRRPKFLFFGDPLPSSNNDDA